MVVPSKGIPSKESLWFPPKDSKKWKTLDPDIRWELKDIIEHIFPTKYEEKYHEIALSFIQTLLKKQKMFGEEIASWIKENNFSKATFYNKVLPKLVNFGLIKRERFGKKLILSPSTTFSMILEKLAKEWRSIVKTSRVRSPGSVSHEEEV